MTIPTKVQRLTRQQCGCVTRRQCLDAGMTRTAIATLLQQRWQRPHPGVYVTSPRDIKAKTAMAAAVLHVGGDVVLSHESALALQSPTFPLPPQIHLAVSPERHVVAPPGVVIHRLPRLEFGGPFPWRMSAEQAAVEVTHLMTDPAAVISLMCEVMGAKLAYEKAIRVALDARPRHRWRSLLAGMLVEVAEGAQSPLELADLRNDEAHGLPTASRQVAVRIDGRRRWLDATVTVPETGARLQKELDGRLGHEESGRFRDMRRDNDAVLRGRTPLRFGWLDMHVQPCETAAVQVMVLRRLGWTGVPESCGDGCRTASTLVTLQEEYA